MPFSAQHILAILFGGIIHGDQCRVKGGWGGQNVNRERIRVGMKGKQTNEQNKKQKFLYFLRRLL